MKNIQKIALTLSAITVLTTGIALANTAETNQGIKVTGPVDICSLPSEAESGSISVSKKDKHNYHNLSKISASDAAKIAKLAYPGITTEVELEKENKSLIWEVTQYGENGEEVELMIDAGNGNLLAAEREDDDDGITSWFRSDHNNKKKC